MADLCVQRATLSNVPKAESSNKRNKMRSRPNLSKLCVKTKMCSFYLRGACTRAESCTFAHDEKDIQSKPDLSCTKLCPDLLSIGHCSRPGCKFAHDGFEMRQIDLEEPNTPPMKECESMPPQAEQSSIMHNPISSLSPFAGSGFSTNPVHENLQTAPQVVSRMNDAALSGAVSLGETIYQLTHIFTALYEARPDIATHLKVPAAALASATSALWADAGIDTTALLSFQDIARLCAPPSAVQLQEVSRGHATLPQPVAAPSAGSPQPALKKPTAMKDSDTWSECSTDDGCNSYSVSRCNSKAFDMLESCEDLEGEGWREPVLGVRNTFIHFSPRRCPNRGRRAKSLPGRLS